MPGGYRIEISANRRAGCQSTECKHDGIKIQKGELRFGTLVTIMEHQSWRWKHWGCVTPKQLYNLKINIEDEELETGLDGYAELEEFEKNKIARAIEEGHVADDDWRGDAEVNRPGQKGFRTPASKKKAREEAKAPQVTKDEDDSPSERPSSKKRSRVKKEPDLEGSDQPAPKKAKAATRKGKNIKNEEHSDEPLPTKKVQRKSHKAVKKEEADLEAKIEDNDEDNVMATSKKRKAPRKPASQRIKAENIDEDSMAKTLSAYNHDGAGDGEDESAEEVSKAKKGRKPKGKHVSESAPASKASSKSHPKKAAAPGPTHKRTPSIRFILLRANIFRSKTSTGRVTRSSGL